jgi:hypothetical protein
MNLGTPSKDCSNLACSHPCLKTRKISVLQSFQKLHQLNFAFCFVS